MDRMQWGSFKAIIWYIAVVGMLVANIYTLLTNRDDLLSVASGTNSINLVCITAVCLRYQTAGFIALTMFIILNNTWIKPYKKKPSNQLLMEFELLLVLGVLVCEWFSISREFPLLVIMREHKA